MAEVYKYRIHPAIGVARIGQSAEEIAGPDTPYPDFVPTPPPGKSGAYKDAGNLIRRQIAVFRIYEYKYPNARATEPSDVREITMDQAKIEWTVKLANRKSLDKNGIAVVIDGGEAKLDTKSQGPKVMSGSFDNKSGLPAVTVILGKMSTDSNGRLRAGAGVGISDAPGMRPAVGADLANYRFNPGWFDDIADGPVTAKIDFTGFAASREQIAGAAQVTSAWLVTAAPDFAHAIEPIISLDDVAFAVAHSPAFGTKRLTLKKPSFARHIYPILHKSMMVHWTSDLLHTSPPPPDPSNHPIYQEGFVHQFEKPAFDVPAIPNFKKMGEDRLKAMMDPDKTVGSAALAWRQQVMNRLRNPSGGGGDMPRLNKDTISSPTKKLALTFIHYKLMAQWAAGDFDSDGLPPAPKMKLSDYDVKDQPRALDLAHMGSMVGGAFFPGIEVGENVRRWEFWSEPYRIKDTTPPGTLTETLAIPWQADFSACEREDGDEWWPFQRPITVLPGGATSYSGFKEWAPFNKIEMVDRWNELGFLRSKPTVVGTLYVQQEPP
jgi:hypothetical protein